MFENGINKFDALFNMVLEDPNMAESLLRSMLPAAITGQMDGSHEIEQLPSEFMRPDGTHGRSNGLFRIRLNRNVDDVLYVIVQRADKPDWAIVERLIHHTQAILDREDLQVVGKHGRRPPNVLPLLFYHGHEPWTLPESGYEVEHGHFSRLPGPASASSNKGGAPDNLTIDLADLIGANRPTLH